ncbi:hypothetical protein D3C84_1077650 [compost metagenome]
MAAGVRALGVDGAGDQLDKGIQQLLLLVEQALAFDAQRRHPGHRLDIGDALGLEHGQFGLLAGVAVQQHQHANGLALAVVQAGADQVHARAVEGVQ